jgi:hypothetical protein
VSEQQLSEAELRAYLEQLRSAEAGEILVQAYALLGTAAEAKLGQPDARLLIDAMGGMVSGLGDRIEGDLGEQLRAGVGQLQVAQVEAERQLAAMRRDEAGASPSPQGSPSTAGSPSSQGSSPAGSPARPASPPGPAQEPAGGAQPEQSLTDRLWIPGRGRG